MAPSGGSVSDAKPGSRGSKGSGREAGLWAMADHEHDKGKSPTPERDFTPRARSYTPEQLSGVCRETLRLSTRKRPHALVAVGFPERRTGTDVRSRTSTPTFSSYLRACVFVASGGPRLGGSSPVSEFRNACKSARSCPLRKSSTWMSLSRFGFEFPAPI